VCSSDLLLRWTFFKRCVQNENACFKIINNFLTANNEGHMDNKKDKMLIM
jgi:hypothetical protein